MNSIVYIKTKQERDTSPQEEPKITKGNYFGMHPISNRGTLNYPLQSPTCTTPLSSKGKKKNRHSMTCTIEHNTQYPTPL